MDAPELRVLHVRSSAGLYGAEYVILGLLPALPAHGVRATLACLDNPYLAEQALPARARASGIDCVRLPCHGRFDFAAVHALRGLLAHDPDLLLHVHDYKSALYAWLARGRRRNPILATAHGQFSSTPSLHLYHRLERSLMRRFDRVCVVADDMRAPLARAGVDPARIVTVENGIDTNRFAPDVAPLPRRAFGIADGALVFGAAMRLTEQKNPLQLVDAFARVAAAQPHAVLAIAGDGALRDALRAHADALGVGARVHLLGACPAPERFYTMIDVFVLASLYEGLPLALLEAMAAGRRLAVTRVGQVGDVLAGLDVTPVAAGDPDALAAAMLAAAAHAGPSAPLRRRVEERYSVRRMARDYARLYRDARSTGERVVA